MGKFILDKLVFAIKAGGVFFPHNSTSNTFIYLFIFVVAAAAAAAVVDIYIIEEFKIEGTNIEVVIPNSICELNTALRVSADCGNINDCACCDCVEGDDDSDEDSDEDGDEDGDGDELLRI
jgi:hypothetical protein